MARLTPPRPLAGPPRVFGRDTRSRRWLADVLRTVVPLVLGIALIETSVPLARLLAIPALAPAGTMAGVTLCVVAWSHPLRRLLFPGAVMRRLAQAATRGATGAGLVFVGVCLVLAALLLALAGAARATEPPANAAQYLPMLGAEQRAWWPQMPRPPVLAAQVEQETCITLRHLRCWSPRAELRTERERGVGLGQITRTARFDALAELRQQYRDALAGWSWDDASIYDPRLQLRALVLMDLRNWRAVLITADDDAHLAMMLAAYNGGLGGLSSDRALCAGTSGCDRSRWWGHVERTSLKARAAVAGYGRSFFEINREYVRNVMRVRITRYAELP